MTMTREIIQAIADDKLPNYATPAQMARDMLLMLDVCEAAENIRNCCGTLDQLMKALDALHKAKGE